MNALKILLICIGVPWLLTIVLSMLKTWYEKDRGPTKTLRIPTGPSLEDWLKACPKLKYKKGPYRDQKGRYRYSDGHYQGPCPICKGKTPFIVTPRGSNPPMVYCTTCRPSKNNPRAYWAILEAAGIAPK